MPKSRLKSGPEKATGRWAFRAAAICLLVSLPLLVEGSLRLFGVGSSTCFLVREGDHWFPNEKFGRQFLGPRGTSRPVYFRVPARKGPDTARIVMLGESAAMGTPDPAFSFARILEVMLEARFPGKKIELVNAAMRGIDSHVVREIARDCARLEPDLFIIYMGNNEVIGLHGPEPGCSRMSQWPWLIRAAHSVKSTRVGQVSRNLLGKALSAPRPFKAQDMEFFRKHRLPADDWRREAVRRNFASNLEDICRSAARARARVVLSLVPVNVKDFPPLGWLPSEKYSATNEWRLGQKFLAAGETNRAREHFQRSLDYDALQFRADSRLNQRIRDVAARFSGHVTLVDPVRVCAEEEGIPGARLFRDHVHPTFEGDYLLARTLLPAVEAALASQALSGSNHAPAMLKHELQRGIPSREQCASLLAYTEWHDAQIRLAIADLTSRPPYHDQLEYRERQTRAENAARERVAKLGVPEIQAALQISLAAVSRRPNDWMLRHNCAQLFQALGRPDGAIEHLESVAQTFPRAAAFQVLLGQALAGAGRIDAAIYHLERALTLDPEDERARQVLAQLRKQAKPP